MPKPWVPGFALILALAALPLQAGPVADAAAGIEARLAAEDYDTALAGARDLLGQIWEQTPAIGFSQSILVSESATGYGIYNARPNDIYKKGEPILLYAEPYGFGYGSPGEGLHSIGFIVDLQVLDASGAELANVPGVTQLDLNSRYMNREFQANITYSLDGIEAGKYTLVTTLRDKNSAKVGSFQTAIEITD